MLRVTKLTDYATVILTVLASEPDAVLSASELAERARLEPTTVSKILKPLAQSGLVAAFRGANGGYRLARPADEIGLIDIVEALEGPLGMTECSVHVGSCGIEQSCGVRANWHRINEVVIDALRGITLAQMLAPLPPKSVPEHDAKRIDLRLATS
jgi:FeS assembly SUF system regulator